MTRYAGIDLAKRTMEACVLDGERIERHGLTTDGKGRNVLASPLGETDTARYEVCRFGNRLARMPEKEAGYEVIALNPGDLRIIWKRRAYGPAKKTDREDALKRRSTCGTRLMGSGAACRFRVRRRRSGRTFRRRST